MCTTREHLRDSSIHQWRFTDLAGPRVRYCRQRTAAGCQHIIIGKKVINLYLTGIFLLVRLVGYSMTEQSPSCISMTERSPYYQ